MSLFKNKCNCWDTVVVCTDCGVLLEKYRASKVTEEEVRVFEENVVGYSYYCDRHKKNYNKIENRGYTSRFLKSNVVCDEEGKIIEEKKK